MLDRHKFNNADGRSGVCELVSREGRSWAAAAKRGSVKKCKGIWEMSVESWLNGEGKLGRSVGIICKGYLREVLKGWYRV
jgi:hypothetical protein